MKAAPRTGVLVGMNEPFFLLSFFLFFFFLGIDSPSRSGKRDLRGEKDWTGAEDESFYD